MDIVVLSHRLPFPPNKGEKIRTYNQLEYLRKSGCNIKLFCVVDSDEELSLAQEYESVTGISVVAVKYRFRKWSMLLGLCSGRALTVSNFYCRGLQKKLDEHASSNTINSVYCTSSAMAEYLFKADSWVLEHKALRRDLIDFMDLDSDKWSQYRKISGFPMTLIYWYEEKLLARYESEIQKYFDVCIFISENEKDLFLSKLNKSVKNIHVVGNGVDLEEFRVDERTFKTNEKTLLFSGVMDYLPNENAMQWFVKHVWPDIKLGHSDIHLVIAGMNPSPAIKNMAEDDSITVTGYVENMLSYYHEASIFVAPFQIARGVQNKILQAFACGLPVVTTPIGAEGIECKDEVHCLLAADAEKFKFQLNRLLNDENCYNRVRRNAIELVNDHYTWEANNEQLLSLFKSTSEG